MNRGKEQSQRNGRREEDSQDNEELEGEERVITIKLREPRKARKQMKQLKDYCKTEPSLQDKVSENPKAVRDKLKGFEIIPQDQYEKVERGTYIRYITFDPVEKKPKIRLGGYLIKNGFPDYWVLRSGTKGTKGSVTWSVQLKSKPELRLPLNTYYRKEGSRPKSEREKAGLELYDAVLSGRYKLIDTTKLAKLTGEAGEAGEAEEESGKASKKTLIRRVDDEYGDSESSEGEMDEHKPVKPRVNFMT